MYEDAGLHWQSNIEHQEKQFKSQKNSPKLEICVNFNPPNKFHI